MLTLCAGQRYSVILEANQTIDNYWIRAIPNRGNANITNGLNSAILRYKGAPQVDPAERNFTSVAALNETSLHPLTALAAPGSPSIGGADVVLNLDMGFLDATNQFTINGAVFVPPTTPVLLQILSGAKNATDLLPSGSVFPLPRNKVIEISMPGKNLHGSPVSDRVLSHDTIEYLPVCLLHLKAPFPFARGMLICSSLTQYVANNRLRAARLFCGPECWKYGVQLCKPCAPRHGQPWV